MRTFFDGYAEIAEYRWWSLSIADDRWWSLMIADDRGWSLSIVNRLARRIRTRMLETFNVANLLLILFKLLIDYICSYCDYIAIFLSSRGCSASYFNKFEFKRVPYAKTKSIALPSTLLYSRKYCLCLFSDTFKWSRPRPVSKKSVNLAEVCHQYGSKRVC